MIEITLLYYWTAAIHCNMLIPFCYELHYYQNQFHYHTPLHCCQVQSVYEVTLHHPFLSIANEPNVYAYKLYTKQHDQHMSTHTYGHMLHKLDISID